MVGRLVGGIRLKSRGRRHFLLEALFEQDEDGWDGLVGRLGVVSPVGL